MTKSSQGTNAFDSFSLHSEVRKTSTHSASMELKHLPTHTYFHRKKRY